MTRLGRFLYLLGLWAVWGVAHAGTLCFPLVEVPSRDFLLEVAERGCDRVFLEAAQWDGQQDRFSPLTGKGWSVVRLGAGAGDVAVYLLSQANAPIEPGFFAVPNSRMRSPGRFVVPGPIPLQVIVPFAAGNGIPSEEAWLTGAAVGQLAGAWVLYEAFALPAGDPGWSSWGGRKIGAFHVKVKEKAVGHSNRLWWLVY